MSKPTLAVGSEALPSDPVELNKVLVRENREFRSEILSEFGKQLIWFWITLGVIVIIGGIALYLYHRAPDVNDVKVAVSGILHQNNNAMAEHVKKSTETAQQAVEAAKKATTATSKAAEATEKAAAATDAAVTATKEATTTARQYAEVITPMTETYKQVVTIVGESKLANEKIVQDSGAAVGKMLSAAEKSEKYIAELKAETIEARERFQQTLLDQVTALGKKLGAADKKDSTQSASKVFIPSQPTPPAHRPALAAPTSAVYQPQPPGQTTAQSGTSAGPAISKGKWEYTIVQANVESPPFCAWKARTGRIVLTKSGYTETIQLFGAWSGRKPASTPVPTDPLQPYGVYDETVDVKWKSNAPLVVWVWND